MHREMGGEEERETEKRVSLMLSYEIDFQVFKFWAINSLELGGPIMDKMRLICALDMVLRSQFTTSVLQGTISFI